jgi:hypothetical protein
VYTSAYLTHLAIGHAVNERFTQSSFTKDNDCFGILNGNIAVSIL